MADDACDNLLKLPIEVAAGVVIPPMLIFTTSLFVAIAKLESERKELSFHRRLAFHPNVYLFGRAASVHLTHCKSFFIITHHYKLL